VHAAAAALSLAQRHQVQVPITEAVTQVLQGKLTPQSAIEQLLSRPARNE
jgi:glycerol-3-phosphate dehydrogenase (NAD(P)+)